MSAAVSLALATLAFVGTHLAMSHPLRAGLVARFGERGFLGLYSLVSLVTFGWMILAYRAGDSRAPAWVAPLEYLPFASGVMLVACILLVGSLIRNPALPHPGAQLNSIPPPKGVFAITRHPMNMSFILWAAVHISISGTDRNLIVASGILVLAVAGSLGQDAKKLNRIGEPWRQWLERTSFLPFAALASGRARWRDSMPHWAAIVGGLLLWAVATGLHAPLVSPLGDWLS